MGALKLVLLLVTLVAIFASVQAARKRCPKGQVFRTCKTCGGTVSCDNPNPRICPLICLSGCECAEGTLLNTKNGQCVKNCSALATVPPPTRRCPNGLVFRQCLSCGGRPLTCKDVLNGVFCPLVCVPGCDCPIGTVLDQNTGRCVQNCSEPTCPIQGQVFKQCMECPGNPFTCADPVHACLRICAPGCECPQGQVLDTRANICVSLELCLY